MSMLLDQAQILEKAALLPAFPTVVSDLLASLEDDNSTLGILSHLVAKDPVITARILSLANSAAMAGHGQQDRRDIQGAVSLIGLARVRELALSLSLNSFTEQFGVGRYFWTHSVAVGVAAQELGRKYHFQPDYALVAGLLHDIGQLWMVRFHPEAWQQVQREVMNWDRDICEAERQFFGLDHTEVGKVLAEHWNLPASLITAIAHHHDGHAAGDKLVAVTHVAEAIVNALDLSAGNTSRVTVLSDQACDLLGIDWQEDFGFLFGKIEARTEVLSAWFQ
ncbi:HDOD domain-containing protein [Azonexus sp. IMCC34839]|uniref:HDOD domain-containing protein n=1 Tax=Azonexus sp. IMCC34839 TaxID=3133695 RepID=UPI00399BFC31